MKKQDPFEEFPDNPDEKPVYELKLFVTGATPNSAQAISNVTNICEEHLPNRYNLEVIDVYQQPSKTKGHLIHALPMLLKSFPLPLKRLIGDMSDTPKVLNSLGLNT